MAEVPDDDLRARLQEAALALFTERGYDRTTAASIAAHAGVTERTFFRYFVDKREVLFGGEAVLHEALTRSIADAPSDHGPLETVFTAFRSVVPLLEGNRAVSVSRQKIIAATPALQEREVAKTAALTDALAEALRARGVADLPAVIASGCGMAAFVHATVAWVENPEPALGHRLDSAWHALQALLPTGR